MYILAPKFYYLFCEQLATLGRLCKKCSHEKKNHSIINTTESIKQKSRKHADELTNINHMSIKGRNANKYVLEKSIMHRIQKDTLEKFNAIIKSFDIKFTSAL